MDAEKIFVGRRAELEQFKTVLENPQGQAVLVVGQAGMGKTWLVNKMAEIAENHPKLKCGYVRYEVTPTDSVDSTMALMMDNAFEAAKTEPGSFDKVPERRKQWIALLKAVVPKGKEIAELVSSLRRDPARNTREQFLERLRLISKRIPGNGRAIFIIDPEKYMQKDSDQSWAIVVKDLPEKIKILFAQRPEDVLVESETFGALDNVSSIPEKSLGILDGESVDELINQRKKEIKYSVTEVREVLSHYEGHPYALQGSLDLLEAGVKLGELPKSHEPIKCAQVQWNKVCNSREGSIELFEAYAVSGVGVPDDVVEAVSGIKSSKRRKLIADKYLKGLLRKEGEGKRIYHAILADYILGQMRDDEKKEYHYRAIEVFRKKLAEAEKERTRPDALAAMRLAEHVLAVEGGRAFVYAFVNECTEPLINLGLLDVVVSLSQYALGVVERNSGEEAAILCNLGLIYMDKGELDESEEMLQKALVISEKLGQLEGMASAYGNLGLIYYIRGGLDKAEEMYNKSLEIDEKLGRLEGMASDYGNLGLIYRRRGELDEAEEMYLKSLEISEPRGMLKLTSNQYGNLGLIYQDRGDLDMAEEMYLKSLEIDEKLGRLEGMASSYGNLGLIYMNKGRLNMAEEMFEKIVGIHEKLGHQEGLANDYSNLGAVYYKRGDNKRAREYLEKALGLYKKMGMKRDVEEVQGFLRRIKGKGMKDEG